MESQGDSTGIHYNYHATTELSGGSGGGAAAAAVGPLFVVLAIIMVLGVLAGLIGRVCSGRHWGVDTQYDFEGWVEKRCANCIDGDVEAPPPPPPDKPAEEAAAGPPPEAPPAPDGAAPFPAPAAVTEAVPLPADEASPPVPVAAEAALPPATPQDAGAEVAAAAATTSGAARTEPLTFMQLYPCYSCRCPICCREGLFE